jgi:hypothetical protein
VLSPLESVLSSKLIGISISSISSFLIDIIMSSKFIEIIIISKSIDIIN